MKATLTIRVELTEETADRLRRPATSRGGFQNVLRKPQANLTDDNVLTLIPALAGTITTYVHKYGSGGFQGRFDLVLRELTELAKAIEPIAA